MMVCYLVDLMAHHWGTMTVYYSVLMKECRKDLLLDSEWVLVLADS